MTLNTFNRLESQVRSYVRAFPTVFKQARDCELIDEQGRRYLDFFSGAGSLNYGHNPPVLKEALLKYVASDGVVHGLDMATSPKRAFLESLQNLILEPRQMQYKVQFTGPTGTNAVEAALKLARQVKKRSNVLCFTQAFHGVTSGSLAVTGNRKFRRAAGQPLANATFVPFDGYMGPEVNTLEHIERLITDSGSGVDHPAAVIVETVQGEGGVNVASLEWLRGLEMLCQRHDMLLIVDDIQIGCGRSGEFFSFESAGISPDIITLSKSLSGYGLPMSIVLMKPSLDIWEAGAHNGTFRGNNLAFVTATAALQHYWRNDALTQDIHRKSALLRQQLEALAADYPGLVKDVRGRGLMQGVACYTGEQADRLTRYCFEHGAILETCGPDGSVVKFLPALTIDDAMLQQGTALFADALRSTSRRPLAVAS